MRWKGREQSENVEDHRGRGPQLAMGGGLGVVGILIVLALQFMGAPREVQQIAGQIVRQMDQQRGAQAPQAGGNSDGIRDENREFISVVLRDTETVWTKLFKEQIKGGTYTAPKLVIFGGAVNSGCGSASAEMGPFYCPADRKVYIDPTFFDDLARRHQAPGDFAQAYVIAHEVAHHVQNLVGYSQIADQARQSGDEREANQASVRLELQADFLAGVWAYYAHKEYDILESGDMEEAIKAANQIGDDTLQREATGRVVPERFTHGTSAQRTKWFKRGLTSGKLKDCEQLFKLPYDQL
ncbi:MAG: neutral zinc metallopeptidase [Planctomyces sp.]